MKIVASAGRFEITCYTDGWPIWTEISMDGEQIARPQADDLPDLIYAVQRLVGKLEASRQ